MSWNRGANRFLLLKKLKAIPLSYQYRKYDVAAGSPYPSTSHARSHSRPTPQQSPRRAPSPRRGDRHGRDTERLVDVVVGDEDADILVAKLSYDALNILHSDRVDTSERFVKHDELRVNGSETQAAISARRRSPPERRLPAFVRTFSKRNSAMSSSRRACCSCFVRFVSSSTERILSSTLSLR